MVCMKSNSHANLLISSLLNGETLSDITMEGMPSAMKRFLRWLMVLLKRFILMTCVCIR